MSKCGDESKADLYLEVEGFCPQHREELIDRVLTGAQAALREFCEENGFDMGDEAPSLIEVGREALRAPTGKGN